MKNILVIGSTGQIGSELTRELRRIYGGSHVVAGYIKGAEPKGELLDGGPAAIADVPDGAGIADIVKNYHIDTIYNLAALLSVVASRWRAKTDVPCSRPVLSVLSASPRRTT